MNLSVARSVIAAATLAALALTVAPAQASGEPADWANPDVEGSLLDTRNLRSASMSDVTGISVSVNTNGCVAVAERPQLQPAPSSSTGMIVKSQIALTCQGLSGARDTFVLQRVRWDWFQPLASQVLAVNAAGGNAAQTITANCPAGTWSYRVAVTGTHTFHTSSARYTCVRSTDVFFIDPS